MKIYAILSEPDNEALVAAIQREFPKNHFDFGDGQWFVAANGTALEVFGKLQGPDYDDDKNGSLIGTVVILSTNGYYGWAGSDLWEWMLSRG